MSRYFVSRVLLGVFTVFVFTSSLDAEHVLLLNVPHVNLDDLIVYEQSTGATSAEMVLLSLGSQATHHQIFDYGRSFDPSFPHPIELDTAMICGTLNHFQTDPNYNYGIVTSDSLAGILNSIAYWMNREIPDVSPLPVHAPAIIPTQGNFENWVVATGTYSLDDPFLFPTTPVYGLWIDDPRILNLDDMGNLIDTNSFWSSDPGSGYQQLDTIYTPMSTGPYAGQYVAIVPIPEPSCIWAIGSLIALACLQRTRIWLRRKKG